jgi:hypothetical protein
MGVHVTEAVLPPSAVCIRHVKPSMILPTKLFTLLILSNARLARPVCHNNVAVAALPKPVISDLPHVQPRHLSKDLP